MKRSFTGTFFSLYNYFVIFSTWSFKSSKEIFFCCLLSFRCVITVLTSLKQFSLVCAACFLVYTIKLKFYRLFSCGLKNIGFLQIFRSARNNHLQFFVVFLSGAYIRRHSGETIDPVMCFVEWAHVSTSGSNRHHISLDMWAL